MQTVNSTGPFRVYLSYQDAQRRAMQSSARVHVYSLREAIDSFPDAVNHAAPLASAFYSAHVRKSIARNHANQQRVLGPSQAPPFALGEVLFEPRLLRRVERHEGQLRDLTRLVTLAAVEHTANPSPEQLLARVLWMRAGEQQRLSRVCPYHGVEEQLQGQRRLQNRLHGVIVRQREAVVVSFRVSDEGDNNVVCEIGRQGWMRHVLERVLYLIVSSSLARGRQAHLMVLPVHVPQALHKDLVGAGHARVHGESLGDGVAAGCDIKVEQDVVEQRLLVVHRHAGVAYLLMELSQGAVGLWGVDLR